MSDRRITLALMLHAIACPDELDMWQKQRVLTLAWSQVLFSDREVDDADIRLAALDWLGDNIQLTPKD